MKSSNSEEAINNKEAIEKLKIFGVNKIHRIISYSLNLGFSKTQTAAIFAFSLLDAVVGEIEETGSGIDIRPPLKEFIGRIDNCIKTSKTDSLKKGSERCE